MKICVRALAATAALFTSACDTTTTKDSTEKVGGASDLAGSPIAPPVASAPAATARSTAKEHLLPTPDLTQTSPSGAAAGHPRPDIRPAPFQPPAEIDPPHPDPDDEVPG